MLCGLEKVNDSTQPISSTLLVRESGRLKIMLASATDNTPRGHGAVVNVTLPFLGGEG